jgi:hypothetical protein
MTFIPGFEHSSEIESFAEPDGLFEGIMAFLEEVRVSELKLVFHHWVERIRWVLDHNGDRYNE